MLPINLPTISVLLAGGMLHVTLGTLNSAVQTQSPKPSISKTSLDAEPPRLVSAFHGLDAMPPIAAQINRDAPGKDGLPITFSRRVLGGPTLDPKLFTLKTRSGAVRQPIFATTRPADAAGKNHTVLLIGDFGSEPSDPPVSVEVTGDLPLEGGANGKGLKAKVIPLIDGPTLVLAMSYKVGKFPVEAPAGTRQIVVAVWAGGVRPKPGTDQTAHLNGYRLTTKKGEVRPIALGNLTSNDNYVYLYLDTDEPATSVRFAPGILVDPNRDVNPETSVKVAQSR